MARFTVSDCMDNISNRFDMTLAAATRARQIEKGSALLISEPSNDKATVIALREIAEMKIGTNILNKIE